MKQIKHLYTEYEEAMSFDLPWNVYPRPSLVRDSFFNLNGSWDFAVTKNGDMPEFSEKILVPFAPEARLSGICAEIPSGSIMHYRRTFSLPENFIRKRVILHFGAVDTVAEVILNGKIIGVHEGGYLPFSFDITDVLCENNELYLKVRDDLDKKYPYGKQTKKRGGMWYTPVSGIWQTVWIESVPENYVVRLEIDTDMNSHLSDEDMSSLIDETPLMRIGNTLDVANAALFLAGDGASFITGNIMNVSGGFTI